MEFKGIAEEKTSAEIPIIHLAQDRVPQVGDIVLYVISESAVRPAMVVRVWRPGHEHMCNLQVFTDGQNDGARFTSGLYWATCIYHVEGEPGAKLIINTWHWPRR